MIHKPIPLYNSKITNTNAVTFAPSEKIRQIREAACPPTSSLSDTATVQIRTITLIMSIKHKRIKRMRI